MSMVLQTNKFTLVELPVDLIVIRRVIITRSNFFIMTAFA